MTDEELIARLRKRAAEERDIQRNNEAVAAALMGQRLLFEQGIRSKANSFAVRLGLEYENCAKNDAKLARDWDVAADRIEELDRACSEWADASQANYQRAKTAEAKLAKAVGALETIAKPKVGPDFDLADDEVNRWRAVWYRKYADIARTTLAELTVSATVKDSLTTEDEKQSHEWKCPIDYPGCRKNCGSYGCGN